MNLPLWRQLLPYTLLFLLTPAPSHQVNIRLSLNGPLPIPSPTSLFPPLVSPSYELICNNIQPGRCCKATSLFIPGWNPPLLVAAITGMMPLDIAAVWKPQNGQGGCGGVPVDSRAGPGTWYYPDRNEANSRWAYPDAREDEPVPGYVYPFISGASYIRVPSGKPDTSATAPWLEAEGIIGLAWGDGKWFSDKVPSSLASSLLGASLGSQLPRMKRSELGKRGIISFLKGRVFAQPPAIPVWPDEVIINGTSYMEVGVGNLTYVSATGETVTMSAGD